MMFTIISSSITITISIIISYIYIYIYAYITYTIHTHIKGMCLHKPSCSRALGLAKCGRRRPYALNFQCEHRDSLSSLFIGEKTPQNQCEVKPVIFQAPRGFPFTHLRIDTSTDPGNIRSDGSVQPVARSRINADLGLTHCGRNWPFLQKTTRQIRTSGLPWRCACLGLR